MWQVWHVALFQCGFTASSSVANDERGDSAKIAMIAHALGRIFLLMVKVFIVQVGLYVLAHPSRERRISGSGEISRTGVARQNGRCRARNEDETHFRTLSHGDNKCAPGSATIFMLTAMC